MQVVQPVAGGPSATAVQPQPVAPATSTLPEEQKQRIEANKAKAVHLKRLSVERMGSTGVRAPHTQVLVPQPAPDSGSQRDSSSNSSMEMSQDSQSQGADMELSQTPADVPADPDLELARRLQARDVAPAAAAGAAHIGLVHQPDDIMDLSQASDDGAPSDPSLELARRLQAEADAQLARQLQAHLPQRQSPASAAAHARAFPQAQHQPAQHQSPQRQLQSAASPRAGGEEVYVLRLQNKVCGQDCYYIGKAKDKTQRVAQHRSSGPRCAKWVECHGGVAEEVRPIIGLDAGLDADTWEQKETIAWVIRLSTEGSDGFALVRGWEWTNPTFGIEDYITFKTLAFGAADLCRLCGSPGHFATQCGGRPKALWLQRCLEGCKPLPPQQQPAAEVQRRPDVSQLIAAQVRAQGSAKPKRPATTAAKPAKRQRASAAASPPRECEGCGADIDSQPTSHRRCLDCFRSSQESSSDANEDVCERCGQDISDQPPSHRLCFDCFSGHTQVPRRVRRQSLYESQQSESSDGKEWRCDFCGKGFDTKKGANFHENFHCRNKPRGGHDDRRGGYGGGGGDRYGGGRYGGKGQGKGWKT